MSALVVLLLLMLVGVGVVLGAVLSTHRSEQQARLDAREARLNSIWHALQATNRINAAFWHAREAMRREAERQQYSEEQAEAWRP